MSSGRLYKKIMGGGGGGGGGVINSVLKIEYSILQ